MATKKSWRDVVPVHPAADVFPPKTEAELKELARDIKSTTLQNRVTLWEQLTPEGPVTYLLDGRGRLDAMELAGIPVLTDDCTRIQDHLAEETSSMSSMSADAIVIALNIRRRHLTAQERADMMAAAVVANKNFLAELRKLNSQVGMDGNNAPPIGQKGFSKGQPAPNRSDVADLAEAAGVSRQTARTALNKAKAEAGQPPVPGKSFTPGTSVDKRREDVGRLTDEGHSQHAIAKELEISTHTVASDQAALGKKPAGKKQLGAPRNGERKKKSPPPPAINVEAADFLVRLKRANGRALNPPMFNTLEAIEREIRRLTNERSN